MQLRNVCRTLAIVGAVVALPVAAAQSASKSVKVNIVGGAAMKPNQYVKDTMRFQKDKYVIAPRGTLSVVNVSGAEPHTFSLVKKSELPKNMAGMNKCYEGGACARLAEAHQFPEGEGPPGQPLVDAGSPGFDTPGDSVVINPEKKGTTKLKVSAKRGSKLYALCILHPWMQTAVEVR